MTASSPGPGRWAARLTPVALVLALGCSGKPVDSPPKTLAGKPFANVGEVAPARDGDADAVAALSAVLAGDPPPANPGRPLNLLVMSGGGKYGAFTAGVMCGWTASGSRPTFDVATGISSGALTATLAFLGPKYDRKLADNFTDLRRSDIYRWQPVRGLLRGTGLLTAEPLDRLLAEEITPEFLADLREAHAAGRRLYVGTAEVLTNRFAVWDLGAIACSGRPDAGLLIRKVLLAACAVPGLVRPVEVEVEVNGVRYTELHADAGNFAQAFVRTPAGLPPGSVAWVLSAGKYFRDPIRDRPRIVKLFAGAVSNGLYALFRADLVKLYALCAVSRAGFRLLALPDDFRGAESSFEFDPEELARLYLIGYQLSAGGAAWRTAPPDTLPGEASPPRTGTTFTAP